jgi:hypothetical protein
MHLQTISWILGWSRNRRWPRADRDRDHLQETSTPEAKARGGCKDGCEKVERNNRGIERSYFFLFYQSYFFLARSKN